MNTGVNLSMSFVNVKLICPSKSVARGGGGVRRSPPPPRRHIDGRMATHSTQFTLRPVPIAQGGPGCGRPARRRQQRGMLLLRGMRVSLLLGLPVTSWAHLDLALLQCDPHDEMQLWSMPARGMGYGGTLSHQATKLCLMVQDCDMDAGTPLVLDDCTSGCLASHPDSAKFTLHHNGGVEPRALEAHGTTQQLYADASSDDPVLTLMPWDAESPGRQQFVSAMPYRGPDHSLQVGNGKDGKPLCAAESGKCCLGAHKDVVPDGDGGWVLIVATAVVAMLYVFGGVYLGQQRTGRYTHIHVEQGKQIWGLVQDGCAFTLAVSRGAARRTATSGDVENNDAAVSIGDVAAASNSNSIVRAKRGQAGPLHHAASVGNATQLRTLLAAGASIDINSGDSRQYTPFAAACAGGHAECVTVLLEAGCDTQLACDTGLTGWELAEGLKRHEVLDLQTRDCSNANSIGVNRSGAKGSTRSKSSAKNGKGSLNKQSSSRRNAASKQQGAAAAERAAPLLSPGATTVVL